MSATEFIQKRTLSAQVAEEIRRRILSGSYTAGAQLRQEHLAQELGISRIPIREALHQLHSEGFVTLVSHKGAIVSEISLEEIRELFELRARIETWLMAIAIPQAQERDVHRAETAFQALAAGDTPVDWSQRNWAFHEALYAPSNRPTTLGMLRKIHQQIERYTRMIVTFDREQQKAHAEHADLLRHWKARDVLRSVNLLDGHIMEAGEFLIARLQELRGRST